MKKTDISEVSTTFVNPVNGLDLVGQRFGRLVVTSRYGTLTQKSNKKVAIWMCQCDCGNVAHVRTSFLKNGRTRSCSCLRDEKTAENLVGKKFGKLTVESRSQKNNLESGAVRWNTICDCGGRCAVTTGRLKSGYKPHCGCVKSVSKSLVDLTGKRFGKLVVLMRIGSVKKDPLWQCQCDCGSITTATSNKLRNYKTHCGCLTRDRFTAELVGQKFGRLTVVEECSERKNNRKQWRCVCECGREVFAITKGLRTGWVRSCGCLKREIVSKIHVTHGKSYETEYFTWKQVIQRATNPKNEASHNYSGRGIGVCDRWLESFENFYADMGDKPEPKNKYTIERCDNNGSYCPENCCWATRKEQSRNKRNNVLITRNGVTATMIEWSEKTDIPYGTLAQRRMAGDSVERMFRPARHRQEQI